MDNMVNTSNDLDSKVAKAVAHFWQTRHSQAEKQNLLGRRDQGARSAVTGGAQMDGFINIFTEIITSTGIKEECIFFDKALELPGYFRPTKEWDLLVVKEHQLIVALEAKSQVGPSFGNNFNNRTEEAMGSALDLWTAYREGAFNKTVKPWLGYLFMLEDCPRSQSPVRVKEPHFEVLPEFKNASYAKRYELFCRKLLRERHYDSTCFIISHRERGLKGEYAEPAEDLTFKIFTDSLRAQLLTYGA
jgi:hypothetical protein